MKKKLSNYHFIGIVETPFKEKFGVPRSSGLAPQIKGRIRLFKEFSHPDAIRSLSTFSHLWLIFDFHLADHQSWSPCVRPPRLGGNQKVGVYASRSPNRPNPIGLSCVAFSNPRFEDGEILIDIQGPDLVDGTPLLDIKPYSASVDRIENAQEGWPEQAAPIPQLNVQFSKEAEELLQNAGNQELKNLITSYLSMDPRPSYKSEKPDDKIYANRIFEYDVQWSICASVATVLNIFPCE